MTTIYIETYSEQVTDTLEVTLETLIVLHIFKACDSAKVALNVLPKASCLIAEPVLHVDSSSISYNLVTYEAVPSIAKYCIWPVVVVDNTVVAGLASVSRQILKHSNSEDVLALLGFREACLMACNETSIWTKFCEIDMPCAVKSILKNPKNYFEQDVVRIPIDLSRFESHMSQPIRIHNVYKLARIKNNNKWIQSNVPVEQLNLDHRYGEGPFMTLSDLLLFPCFKIIFEIFDQSILSSELPLTTSWYENLCFDVKQPKLSFFLNITFDKSLKNATVIQEKVTKQSLYSADPKRYKPQCRIYTRQNDIDKALTIATDLPLNDLSLSEAYGFNVDFSWANVPLDANPLGGSLPKSRASRKCQQLENLAKAAIKIAENKSYTIVDFCSGSGHLGILVAFLLPNSHVVLVENKEKSLQRAQERIATMNLTNVSLVQSNLDYFVAKFDLGVALHACGVATDLVIQTCIKNKAHFICCPCCYGGIHNCHHLIYPRSNMFKETLLTYRDYLTIGHSADQTHDDDNAKTAQGYMCMNVIDTDRKLQAQECGYDVHLSKLVPPTCTPKNNLLVGIYTK